LSRWFAIKIRDVATTAELLAALRRFGLEDDRFDAIVARHFGVGAAEFKAMDHLQAAGSVTPGQLADRMALSSGAVTALIDRLERLGWVRREPHPYDRRSVIVRKAAPSESQSEGEQIFGALVARLADTAKRMTSSERDACVRFLETAADQVAERATELRGSDRAPTRSPAPGSPPTPGA
jgi:DNA-binding MarR family transcriptional regulator